MNYDNIKKQLHRIEITTTTRTWREVCLSDFKFFFLKNMTRNLTENKIIIIRSTKIILSKERERERESAFPSNAQVCCSFYVVVFTHYIFTCSNFIISLNKE